MNNEPRQIYVVKLAATRGGPPEAVLQGINLLCRELYERFGVRTIRVSSHVDKGKPAPQQRPRGRARGSV